MLEFSALIGIFARTVFVWNIAKEMMNVLPDKDAMKKIIARVNATESYAAHPKFASMANVKTHVKKSVQRIITAITESAIPMNHAPKMKIVQIYGISVFMVDAKHVKARSAPKNDVLLHHIF